MKTVRDARKLHRPRVLHELVQNQIARPRGGKPRSVFVKGDDDKQRHPKMSALVKKAAAQVIRRRFHSATELTMGLYASLPRPSRGLVLPARCVACDSVRMGKVSKVLDDGLRAFLAAQRMFFVATAPNGVDGLVNCSPKGLDSFRVLDPASVAYLDLVGSGVETIAHVRDNGRICVMFCAFEGPPMILRLHGRGSVVEPGDAEFATLLLHFESRPRAAVRSIIRVALTRVALSCGFGVPLYRHEGERDQMTAWCEKKGEQGVLDYQREKNVRSLDGLPALRWPLRE